MEDNIFYIHKKLKFLLDLTVSSDGQLVLSNKLTLLLNQGGVYEVDKMLDIINEYFSKIKLDNIYQKEYIFLIPIIFIFPKKEEKTIIIISNPIYLSLLSNIIIFNLFDFYLDYFTRNNFLKKFNKIFYKIIFNRIRLKNTRRFMRKFRFKFNFIKRKKKAKGKFRLGVIQKLNLHKDWRLLVLKWKIKVRKQFKFYLLCQKPALRFDYELLFKLSLIKQNLFFFEFYYFEFKLFFYSLIKFIKNYKKWCISKFRKKLTFKKKVKRNIFGYVIA